MTFPVVAALTGGLLIMLQSALMVWAGFGRVKHQVALGTGGVEQVEMRVRAHGNLAENAAIFVIALALLELSNMNQTVVLVPAVAFVVARVLHAIGVGVIPPSANKPRVLGATTTGFVGLATGALLVWQVVSAAGGAI
jgi:hypothetical protein